MDITESRSTITSIQENENECCRIVSFIIRKKKILKYGVRLQNQQRNFLTYAIYGIRKRILKEQYFTFHSKIFPIKTFVKIRTFLKIIKNLKKKVLKIQITHIHMNDNKIKSE